ncbi:MAG: hypothetical protein IIC03_00200 [Proteobacteria bacterium]|nr:hypothetical protein [Pseudomonadota bacterium]
MAPAPRALPELRDLIIEELGRPAGPEAEAMAARLAARPGVAAVLFYGARLREGSGEGPLDFYLLTDSDTAYHGFGLAALANRLLPPNVYREVIDGPPGIEAARIEAKVAVATLAAFRARMRPGAIDTTFWARFTQPVALVWARAPADREAVIDAVTAAVETAAWWAARLAPETADADETWRALFRHTYGSELRVEGGGRARDLIGAAPERYRRLHRLLIAGRPPGNRKAAARAWRRRRIVGKLRNLARLTKAAFTYRGGIAYALAKVERHSGRPVELSPWQRRWPWLAAPVVLWRLWRERRLR